MFKAFLTNLQSRWRAAELSCRGEASSSARGDDDRHARREEQRASGLAEVVKSNLGKPHSALSAISGSVPLARRAGRKAAAAAARPRTSTAAPMVVGSVASSPKRK